MKELSEIINSKKIFRQEIKASILAIPDKEKKDRMICGQLAAILPDAGKIISYRADRYEVCLEEIWKTKKKLKVFYPKVTGSSHMMFVFPEEWHTGPHGILEPAGSDIIEPEDADLCIIPALAYNDRGFRLGRGQGYYDRKLENTDSNKLVGVTYEPLFPAAFREEPHDKAVGRIVTEKGVRTL